MVHRQVGCCDTESHWLICSVPSMSLPCAIKPQANAALTHAAKESKLQTHSATRYPSAHGLLLPRTGQWLCLRSDDCNSPFFVHLALVATAQHPQTFPSPSTIKLPCPSHLREHFFVMDSGCLFFFLTFANILNKTAIVFVSPLARSGMVWVSSVPQSSFSISSVIFRASFCKYEGF